MTFENLIAAIYEEIAPLLPEQTGTQADADKMWAVANAAVNRLRLDDPEQLAELLASLTARDWFDLMLASETPRLGQSLLWDVTQQAIGAIVLEEEYGSPEGRFGPR